MKRRLKPEEVRLWAAVAKTVRPARGRTIPTADEDAPSVPAKPKPAKPAARTPIAAAAAKRKPLARAVPDAIEPGRKRRIVRERDPIEARIDLHGLGQFEAQDRLAVFLARAQAMGLRAVLVITGKGTRGDGIIRRRTPEWLADPALRDIVAGFSQAHHRHGGEGALYVAIKRQAAK
jgi:DNA-nicking Smr family endonuclease